MTALGVGGAVAGEEADVRYVTGVSIGAAAFATTGRRGKPPELCASTNAAAKNAIAAPPLHAFARGRAAAQTAVARLDHRACVLRVPGVLRYSSVSCRRGGAYGLERHQDLWGSSMPGTRTPMR